MRPRPIHIGLIAGLLLTVLCANGQKKPAPPSTKQDALVEFSHSIRDLTKSVSPAVVQIMVSGYGSAEEGEGQQVALLTRQRSTGSGVVIDPDGYIVTNAHVVRGAVSVRVLVPPKGAEMEPPAEAKIVGIDRGTDLALIKINRTGLATLRFGDSDSLRQGDIVLALGSPLGLKNSLSMGVVSSPARQISDDSPLAYIQTDAPINPGNSGGALVNVEGLLMGINSFIFSQSGGSQGIGFAIPSNIVQNVCQQLRKKGHVHRGEVGLFVQDISPTMAEGLKLPRMSGVIVADVEADGPADKAGLKQRDILLSMDDHMLEFSREFEIAFYRRMGGDKVSVRVLRDGKELPKPLTMEVAEDDEGDDDSLAASVKPETNLVGRLGILCIELDSRIAKLLPKLRGSAGLIVAAKSPEGQGRYIDLQAGDVIYSMNDMKVDSLEAFRLNVSAFKPGEAVVLMVERSGVLRYISFEIE